MAKRGRPPKSRQTYIPGTEPIEIKEVSDAAEAYYDAVQERLPLTAIEKEAKENLILRMVENQLTRYEYDDRIVSLTDLKNVKIRKKSETPIEE